MRRIITTRTRRRSVEGSHHGARSSTRSNNTWPRTQWTSEPDSASARFFEFDPKGEQFVGREAAARQPILKARIPLEIRSASNNMSSVPASNTVQARRCERERGFWVVAAAIFMAVASEAIYAEAPRVFLLDGAQLQLVAGADCKRRYAIRSSARIASSRARIGRSTSGPFSVVNKDVVPPSGDQHDYMSLAPYWWPNPDTKDGLPYIQRDGKRNPDIYKVRNRHDLGELADTVDTLSLAYYFTRDEKYADRARILIRTWFFEPKTRMNPNFEFAQAIRGLNTGRGLGLIESRLFTKVVDAAGLLDGSQAWTHDDQQELEHWFTSYLQWMLTSNHGRDEAQAKNNHGTYYDIQVASFALFLGKKDLATEVLQNAKMKRIAVQIEPDGRQPLELVRTKAWSYSIGNLSGLMSLARLGEHVGIDLWNFKTPDGRSIRAALDFLTPFGLGAEKWPYQQIEGFSGDAIQPLLRQAAAKYPDGPYRAIVIEATAE